MTLEEFSKEYDDIFARTQALFDEFQPCQVRDGTCGAFRDKVDRGVVDPTNFCCAGCEHLSETGCIVQAVWCKVWTCYWLDNTAPAEFKEKLKHQQHRLNTLMFAIHKRCGFFPTTFRQSKEQIVAHIKEQEESNHELESLKAC